MDFFLYIVVRAVVLFIQILPLRVVAGFGRALGGLFYWIDARHRRVAMKNLTACFGEEKTPEEIRAITHENFRRLGENYLCAVKTAAMTIEQLRPYVEFFGDYEILREPDNKIFAIGHFGNFELYARFNEIAPTHQCATTYRALNQPSLNRIMLSLREKSGCLFFERRTDAAALKIAMQRPGLLLGLLSDQHAVGGLRLPFFGRECSTTTSPAVFALRYHCQLYTAICYRVGPGRWKVEGGAQIPTHVNGVARSTAEIMLDVNRALEVAVRRDPANWFWVHNRWKQPKPVPVREPKISGEHNEATV
ncbi:MAG TPA: hypothetical protein VH255_04435 [Verrucomicrobiae bacterium]|jgi:KDO2-lipid IV(A) lauroyltransferase|nr:hypothetical protein [Verrucomicrobiae bacterium]